MPTLKLRARIVEENPSIALSSVLCAVLGPQTYGRVQRNKHNEDLLVCEPDRSSGLLETSAGRIGLNWALKNPMGLSSPAAQSYGASTQDMEHLQKKYPPPWLHDAFWLVLKKCTSICLSLDAILLPRGHFSPFHHLSSLILSLNHRFPSLCKISAWAAASIAHGPASMGGGLYIS
ncbi:hypothetical protein D5086_008990 [Populus alba]|uniref:Uncharacterized protein n=1 Tax=Populus alba TaxID=43335 RepID=A0ACC4CH18_POPAL